MSLRQARFNDHWRHVFSRNYPTRFTEISFTSLSCLADARLNFSGGINAIVGSNGVGKSTLIGAIAELLADDPNSVSYRARLSGSSTHGKAFVDGTELHLAVSDDAQGGRVQTGSKFAGEFRWLDPSSLASRCINQIATDSNFGDLLESVTPHKLSPTELKIACYLVGKIYSEIEIYEISDYGDLERFPYFRASSAGITYGSEGTGRGELSLLLNYWALRDLPKNSVLILEEPEAHVSPRSQDSLMNVIAKFCDENGMWVIVTTHSPTIIRRIPKHCITLLARDNGPSALVANATKLDMALLLGGGVAFSGVMLVEDEGAKGFLATMLEELAPDTLRQFEVIVAGSESKITAALKAMPVTRAWLTLIGVYDGDMRAVVDGNGFQWPFKFLPGQVAPEQILTGIAQGAQDFVESIAADLHKTAEQIMLALDHAAGSDLHDYFGEFARALNLETSTVRRGFVRIWLQNADNLRTAQQFIDEISGATNQQGG
jgi:predicted ATPase